MSGVSHANPGAFDTLLVDVRRIKKSQKKSRHEIQQTLDKLIESLGDTLSEIDQIQEEKSIEKEIVKLNFDQLHQTLLETKPIRSIFNSHQEHFAYISQLGQDLQKTFDFQEEELFEDAKFPQRPIINIIQSHYLHQGNEEYMEYLEKNDENEEKSLKKELMMVDEQTKDTQIQSNNLKQENSFNNQSYKKIKQIIHISREIEEKKLQSALKWINEEKQNLESIESALPFQVHKMQFVTLVKQGKQPDAIALARTNFQSYIGNQKNQQIENEVQRLMTSLIYTGVQNSPFNDLYDEQNWEVLGSRFFKDSCAIYGTPESSVLQTILKAGTVALPKFLKLSSVMDKEEWQSKNQYPIDIEIGQEFQFHSSFVCPVSRELSHPVDDPPVLLKCGHVLSKNSLKKIISIHNQSKFKCPTCPIEQQQSETKQIFFE